MCIRDRSEPCTEVGDLLQVTGKGFEPNESGQMQWVDPLGMPRRATLDGEVVFFEADDNGQFEVTLRVPQAVPLTAQPAPGQTLTHAAVSYTHLTLPTSDLV